MGCTHSAHRESRSQRAPAEQAVEREESLTRYVPAPSAQDKTLSAQDTDWTWVGGGAIEPHLGYTTLLDVRWLDQLARKDGLATRFGGILPPWQGLPKEAEAPLDSMKLYVEKTKGREGLSVLVLSYPWWSINHPDPDGQQLQQLRPIFEGLKYHCNEDAGPDATFGVLWDFAAFPQKGWTADPGRHVVYSPGNERFREVKPGRFDDRTEEQLARFGNGLKSINEFYVARYTYVLCIDTPIDPGAINQRPYSNRGWCKFEFHISTLCKSGFHFLRASYFYDVDDIESYWVDAITSVADQPVKIPPMDPVSFERMMREGLEDRTIAFTAGADLEEIVLPNYQRGFLKALQVLEKDTTQLSYCAWNWDDDALAILACTLTYAQEHNCLQNIDTLEVHQHPYGSDGAKALANAFQGGCLPDIRHLNLSHTQIGPRGVCALIEAAKAGAFSKLQKLNLKSCPIAEEGLTKLADAINAGAFPSLTEFGYDFGTHGALDDYKSRFPKTVNFGS